MKTYVEGMAAHATIPVRSEATQTFLHISQPTSLPHATTLGPGCSATFPFTFVVPTTLLDTSCCHRVASPGIRTAHLSLPPSLGDSKLSSSAARTRSLDDIAPDMTKIMYGVRVRLSARDLGSNELTLIAEKFLKLRILPTTHEEPPLMLSHDSPARHDALLKPDYQPRRERTLRRSILPLSRNTGRLAVQTAQPAPFRLPHPGSPTKQADTLVTLRVRFDPLTTDAYPPHLGDLVARLNVGTFFATAAMRDLPSRSGVLCDCTQGAFHETLLLSRRSMRNVAWRRHDSSAQNVNGSSLIRHDSGISVSADTDASSGAIKPSKLYDPALAYYTATLTLPVRLPADKAWIPTFHSCLVSRIYTLELALVVDAPGAGRHMDVSVPVQVSAVSSGNIGVKDVVKIHDLHVGSPAFCGSAGAAYDAETMLGDPMQDRTVSRDRVYGLSLIHI